MARLVASRISELTDGGFGVADLSKALNSRTEVTRLEDMGVMGDAIRLHGIDPSTPVAARHDGCRFDAPSKHHRCCH